MKKRASVRLAAVGGKQVRAELTGIGDAGKKGFGKASREMEIANAKLAKFARRAKIAVGVMVAAAAAAGIAMVRSSLTRGLWVAPSRACSTISAKLPALRRLLPPYWAASW